MRGKARKALLGLTGVLFGASPAYAIDPISPVKDAMGWVLKIASIVVVGMLMVIYGYHAIPEVYRIRKKAKNHVGLG
jgi:CDP-diglyceride synthetase